jgi:hypothetical protein
MMEFLSKRWRFWAPSVCCCSVAKHVQKDRCQDQTNEPIVWPGTNNLACCTTQNDAWGIQFTTLATLHNCVGCNNTKNEWGIIFLVDPLYYLCFPSPPPFFFFFFSSTPQFLSLTNNLSRGTTIDFAIPRIPPPDFTLHHPHTVLQQ